MRLQAAPRRSLAAAATPRSAHRRWRQARLQVRILGLPLPRLEIANLPRLHDMGTSRNNASLTLHCSHPLPLPSRQPSHQPSPRRS